MICDYLDPREGNTGGESLEGELKIPNQETRDPDSRLGACMGWDA